LIILNATRLDEYDMSSIGGWLKAVFLNYVQQNIKYVIKKYIYIHNIGYVEVLSENAVNKISLYYCVCTWFSYYKILRE